MAHNIFMRGGQYGFAFNAKNGLPWHGLGQAVDAMTCEQAMQKAMMDWTVSKRPLFGSVDGAYNPVDAWGIFRDDNNAFLGVVGSQYAVIQNAHAFDFVDSLLEAQDGAHYDTAGVLGNGERIFISATVPHTIAPDRAPDDKTNCHLMFCTSHDGSLSATAKLTTVRVVCQNTLSMALGSKGFGELKARHTDGGREKLDGAKKMITGINQTVESLRKKLNALADRKISKSASMAIMAGIFGDDWQDTTHKRNQVQQIAQLFDYNDGNQFPTIKGSAYNMLQAVTNWVDHEKSVRTTDSTRGMSEELIRTQAAIFNGGDAMKSQALEIILQETETAEPMPELAKIFASVEMPKPTSKIDSILEMVSQ